MKDSSLQNDGLLPLKSGAGGRIGNSLRITVRLQGPPFGTAKKVP
jgi:hypothetical protein